MPRDINYGNRSVICISLVLLGIHRICRLLEYANDDHRGLLDITILFIISKTILLFLKNLEFLKFLNSFKLL